MDIIGDHKCHLNAERRLVWWATCSCSDEYVSEVVGTPGAAEAEWRTHANGSSTQHPGTPPPPRTGPLAGGAVGSQEPEPRT